jgi:hypothetical protein
MEDRFHRMPDDRSLSDRYVSMYIAQRRVIVTVGAA